MTAGAATLCLEVQLRGLLRSRYQAVPEEKPAQQGKVHFGQLLEPCLHRAAQLQ